MAAGITESVESDNPTLVWFGPDLRLADNPALERAVARRGAVLPVRRGFPAEALLALAAESGAKSIFWNRRYEVRSSMPPMTPSRF